MEESDGSQCLLIVNSSESCLTTFQSTENEKDICSEEPMTCLPPRMKSDNGDYFKPNIQYCPINYKKPTQNPLFRRKIMEAAPLKLEKECEISINKEIVQSVGKNCGQQIIKENYKVLHNIYSKLPSLENKKSAIQNIAYYTLKFILINMVYIFNGLALFFGNKTTWHVVGTIYKLSLTVFVYLVLACSTIIVVVLLNSYEMCSNKTNIRQSKNEPAEMRQVFRTTEVKVS